MTPTVSLCDSMGDYHTSAQLLARKLNLSSRDGGGVGGRLYKQLIAKFLNVPKCVRHGTYWHILRVSPVLSLSPTYLTHK